MSKKSEEEKFQIFLNFHNNLLENTKEMDPDIAKIVQDNFWDLISN